MNKLEISYKIHNNRIIHLAFTLFIVITLTLTLTSCDLTTNQNITLGTPITFDKTKNNTTTRADSTPVDTQYRYKYIKGISGEFASQFSNLVSDAKFNEWVDQFEGMNPQGTRDIVELNLISFIREFNISKQAFTKANNSLREQAQKNGWESRAFTQKEVEVLYSNETALINKTFVNPDALLYNGEIYTLEWFAENSVSDYIAVGFPPDLLFEKCEVWQSSTEFSIQKEGIQLVVANVNAYEQELESKALIQAEDFLYSAQYCWDFYNIPAEFSALVPDQNDFTQWSNQFKAVNFDGDISADEYTILNFIRYFNIDKESFVDVNTQLRDKGTNLFNDTQIEALFTGDETAINSGLMNPQAILYNNIIYPPKWFADNDARAYKQEQIPLELLQQKCVDWEKDNIFAKQKDGIKGIKEKIAQLEVMK